MPQKDPNGNYLETQVIVQQPEMSEDIEESQMTDEEKASFLKETFKAKFGQPQVIE